MKSLQAIVDEIEKIPNDKTPAMNEGQSAVKLMTARSKLEEYQQYYKDNIFEEDEDRKILEKLIKITWETNVNRMGEIQDSNEKNRLLITREQLLQQMPNIETIFNKKIEDAKETLLERGIPKVKDCLVQLEKEEQALKEWPQQKDELGPVLKAITEKKEACNEILNQRSNSLDFWQKVTRLKNSTARVIDSSQQLIQNLTARKEKQELKLKEEKRELLTSYEAFLEKRIESLQTQINNQDQSQGCAAFGISNGVSDFFKNFFSSRKIIERQGMLNTLKQFDFTVSDVDSFKATLTSIIDEIAAEKNWFQSNFQKELIALRDGKDTPWNKEVSVEENSDDEEQDTRNLL